MSKLQRWHVWTDQQFNVKATKDSAGEWVHYEDAKKLEEEIERLKQIINSILGVIAGG